MTIGVPSLIAWATVVDELSQPSKSFRPDWTESEQSTSVLSVVAFIPAGTGTPFDPSPSVSSPLIHWK